MHWNITENSGQVRRSLKIVPKDVQILVMSVLANKDLSSLMRTRKNFLDLGLTELTRRGPIL